MDIKDQSTIHEQLLQEDDEEGNMNDTRSVDSVVEERPEGSTIVRTAADYKHIDGLRGIGALCVYNCHFVELLVEESPTNKSQEHWFFVMILRTPLRIFVQGPFWVLVFFIISGFVLPMRSFGGVTGPNLLLKMIKRYFRLMIPLFASISIYYVCVKHKLVYWDWFSVIQFSDVPRKSFGNLWMDGLFYTWVGHKEYNQATWTLAVEFWLSLVVYIAAFIIQRCAPYKKPIYIVVTLIFIAIKFLQWNTNILGGTKFRLYLPLFILGTALCENDLKEGSLSDKVRALAPKKRAVLYTICIILGLTYSSYQSKRFCNETTERQKTCRFWQYTTIDYAIPQDLCWLVALISMFTVVLSSQRAKTVLECRFVQFLGKVSYVLYLIHTLVLYGPGRYVFRSLTKQKIDPTYCAMIAYVAVTPLLFAVSALLEVIHDRPGRFFASDFVQLLQDRDCSTFMKKNRIRLGCAVVWFTIVYFAV